MVAAFLAWRIFELGEKFDFLGRVDRHVTDLMNTPYFSVGNLPITPALLLQALVFLALLALGARQAVRGMRRVFLDRSALDEGQKYAIEKTSLYAIYLFGVLIALHAAGFDLSSLAVFGGALGVGIAFGLQAITNNFVSGLILLLEHPLKVGDRVEVNGMNGDVVRIGARATWVRSNEGIVIIVPNSEFITKPVVNWTAGDRLVRFSIPIGVSYSSDPEAVRQILLDEAKKHPDVAEHPAADVVFLGFGDSSLDFELRVWTERRVQTSVALKSDLYFAVFKAFAAAGIEIPFPQRVVHMRPPAGSGGERQ